MDFLCFTAILFALILFLNSALLTYCRYYPIKAAHASDIGRGVQEYCVFLPRMYNLNHPSIPLINIPDINHDQGDYLPEEAAAFWLGKVTHTENYADVRFGYAGSST